MFGADKGTPEAGSSRLNGKDLKIGIVQARFNEPITDALAQACTAELIALGVAEKDITLIQVPGALEVGRAMHSWSLDASLARVATEGQGVLVFLNCGESPDQLLSQIDGTARASYAPERGRMDLRNYGIGAQILRECGVHKMNLLGNPRRMPSMTGYGLEIVGFIKQ